MKKNKLSKGTVYTLGIMRAAVDSSKEAELEKTISETTNSLRQTLSEDLNIDVKLFSFAGPHLTPSSGTYAALDFLKLGLNEKVERDIDFLLIVTEVDLAASSLAFALALPSQLTNVAIVSTKRLDPAFWGETANTKAPPKRLVALLLHSFGHLLNLSHDKTPTNVMFDFKSVEDLDSMLEFSDTQKSQALRNLPIEARERVTKSHSRKWLFILRAVKINTKGIFTGIIKANPFHLISRLPTMLTAAVSVLIFLFFTPDMWDVASTIELYQLIIFSIFATIGATFALYKTFAFGPVLSRNRLLSESAIVTEVVTLVSLFLTITLINTMFIGLSYTAIISIFPEKLMETWTTVVPAVGGFAHLKLSLLISGLSLFAGSLGGRADSSNLIRGVLFTEEES